MIGAILLAAGKSTRMGEPKLLLPWEAGETIISHVVKQYLAAGVGEVIVVTGAFRERVEGEIDALPVHPVFNPRFSEGEMLSSLQVGIRRLRETGAAAALISPADIPAVDAQTISRIIRHWEDHGAALLSPSYRQQGGHPILIERWLWKEILELGSGETLRTFLRARADQREYLEVDDEGILQDIDSPQDYDEARPSTG